MWCAGWLIASAAYHEGSAWLACSNALVTQTGSLSAILFVTFGDPIADSEEYGVTTSSSQIYANIWLLLVILILRSLMQKLYATVTCRVFYTDSKLFPADNRIYFSGDQLSDLPAAVMSFGRGNAWSPAFVIVRCTMQVVMKRWRRGSPAWVALAWEGVQATRVNCFCKVFCLVIAIVNLFVYEERRTLYMAQTKHCYIGLN